MVLCRSNRRLLSAPKGYDFTLKLPNFTFSGFIEGLLTMTDEMDTPQPASQCAKLRV